MALNITKEVCGMQKMTVRELRDRYEDVFGEACRSNHKQWLIRRIAWRLQANEEGGLSERARNRAAELAKFADLRTKAPKKNASPTPAAKTVQGSLRHPGDSRLPMPGTILTRKYKGETVQATVLENGFDYQGEVYSSLTAVAKTITGTHTNGFLFFRLNGKRASK